MAISFNPTVQLSGPWTLAQTGTVFGCTIQGYSHFCQSLPCQDSHAIRLGTDGLKVAVADGHGDPRHSLSQWGAQLAVQTALDGHPSKEGLIAVQHQWTQAVQHHARTHHLPLELFHYGTTLQMLSLQDAAIHAAQIGDGSMWQYHQEQGASGLLQSTEDLIGLSTRSLSVTTDLVYAQETTCSGLDDKTLVVLTTDGLVDSFSTLSEWERFVGSLGQRVQQYGFSAVCEAVPDWLKYYSQKGCGDDMSLVLLQTHLPS